MMLQKLHCYYILFLFLIYALPSLAFSFSQINKQLFDQAKNFEGSSDFVNLEYHMGPVLASPINLYIIWYGRWSISQQATTRDFIYSFSSSSPSPSPSVADWWRTVRFYTDQTGSNITGNIVLSGEYYDSRYSHGGYLSRLDMQSIIKTAVITSYTSNNNTTRAALPLDPHNGLYLVLTSRDVQVSRFL